MQLTRREFTAMAGGLFAVSALGVWGHKACQVSGVGSWMGKLSEPLKAKALALKPYLHGKRFKNTIEQKLSLHACPAFNFEEAILREMKEDQQNNRLKAVDGWIVPETAVMVAKEVISAS